MEPWVWISGLVFLSSGHPPKKRPNVHLLFHPRGEKTLTSIQPLARSPSLFSPAPPLPNQVCTAWATPTSMPSHDSAGRTWTSSLYASTPGPTPPPDTHHKNIPPHRKAGEGGALQLDRKSLHQRAVGRTWG